MTSSYSLRLVQFGQAQQPHTLRAGAGHEGKPLVLRAQSGMRFQLVETQTLQAPVKLRIERQGQDLLLTLPEGDPGAPDVVIKGYFDAQDVAVMGRSSAGDWRVYDNGSPLSPGQDNGISVASLHDGQAGVASLATPPGEGWFEGEKGWVLAGIGAVGLVAGTASLGKSSGSDASADIDRIKAYAGHSQTATAPAVSDYEKAGIKNVDVNNLAAINSAVAVTPLDMAVIDNVQKVVDSYVKVLTEANSASPDASPDADPSVADYQNLGVLLGAQQGNANALALLNDVVKGINTDGCDSVTELKAIVAVVQKVMNVAAGLAPASALTTDDLLLLGLNQAQLDAVHAKDNLSAIISAIGATADDGSAVSSVSKLQTLMAAYDKVLTESNGSTLDADVLSNPAASDFSAIGANIGRAATTATALSMLDQVIGGLQHADVDTVGEINAIAAALDKVSAIAAASTADTSAPTLSATELSKLGLSGFSSTGANNQAVADLLSATVRDLEPSDVDTLPELQSLASLEVLRVWAKDAAVTKTAQLPTADDYTGLGAQRTNVNGVPIALAASDVTALNSFADNLSDAQLDSADHVQHLAASLFKLLNEANGTSADGNAAVNPSAADYVTLGVAGHAGGANEALHAPAAQLLTDVVATKTSDQVDTPTELNVLSSAVDHVLDVAAGTAAPSTLNLEQFSALGVTGLTASNLATVGNLVHATADDGSGVDTLAQLQSVISLARVERFADDANVSAGGSNENGLPTLADYAAVGATLGSIGTVPASNLLVLMNEAVGAKSSANVDTAAKVQAMQEAVTKVMQLAAIDKTSGASDADSVAVGGFSASDLSQLGLDVSLLTTSNVSDTVLAHRLTDVRNHIVYSDNTGLGVEHLNQLQAFINAAAVIVS
ncbi:MAG: hypothetical protein JF606_03135 [Burkholderiales bacterium]|nr:hypothetical protein [Burkholderiales bacterium]